MQAEPLLAALDRTKYGVETFSSPLIRTITLELWLRALEQRRLSSPKRYAGHAATLLQAREMRAKAAVG
jgi:hypothetical protein